jgi:hypothetical protein
MVHMKALSVLFNFPYENMWVNTFRYEQNLTVLWSSVAVSE